MQFSKQMCQFDRCASLIDVPFFLSILTTLIHKRVISSFLFSILKSKTVILLSILLSFSTALRGELSEFSLTSISFFFFACQLLLIPYRKKIPYFLHFSLDLHTLLFHKIEQVIIVQCICTLLKKEYKRFHFFKKIIFDIQNTFFFLLLFFAFNKKKATEKQTKEI